MFARKLRDEYVRSLAREIRQSELRSADTLYLGGGSPSLLEPEEFSALTDCLPRSEWAEATIEVAPGEATPERLAAWAGSGIDRVSFGVQSFVPEVARAAGRKHDGPLVQVEAGRLARAGIRNLSVDLIAGLARQSSRTWEQSLEWVERLAAGHVSVYMLERDDGSRLGSEIRRGGSRYGAAEVPSEDEALDLYLHAVERLADLGYERYEISNFARPGMRSRHNLKYWSMEPYFGFGSDAHSFDGRQRWANVATAPEYVRRMAAGQSPRATCETVGPEQMLEDRVLTGLRTKKGVRLGPGERSALRPGIDRLAAREWLAADGPSLRLTSQGLLFADEAVAELLA